MSISLEDIKNTLQDTTVASVIGSLASLRFVPGVSWWTRASIVLIGAGVAFYALPPVITWFGVKSKEGFALASATVGFLGYNGLAKLSKYADETSFPELITGLINLFTKKAP